METRFLSKRGWIIYFPLALFPFIFSFVFLFIARENPDELLFVFWIFVPLYIFLLSILKTSYTIRDNTGLILRTSFFRKRLPIGEITKITRGNHPWFVGWKFALSTKGMIIHYGKYEEVLISPEKEQDFIDTLLSLNPDIEIQQKKG
ncbi:MAG: hypothetical protein K0R65_3019 [Crocinitomicaceae bacterium]|jgi:hypothetical protein|nr:hypothetical protein [Crocinitomicaceae bacterium]